MTEADWLACANPDEMLGYLEDRVSPRKLRLFACACCGAVRDLIREPLCRAALEAAAAAADGHVSAAQLQAAYLAARQARPVFANTGRAFAAWAATWTANPSALLAAAQAAAAARDCLVWFAAEGAMSFARAASHTGAPQEDKKAAWQDFETACGAAGAEVRAEQAELLREIIGNPFCPGAEDINWPLPLVQLALAVYDGEDCAFALHDALEEAGDSALAGHFRSPSHPPGCWAVDLVLGKE